MKYFLRVARVHLIFLPCCLVGAPPPAPPSEAAAIIRDWLADPATKAPGIAVVAVNASGILWSGGFGLANIEQQQPVTPSTRWQLASVTKVYTALLLAQLAHEGVVDLDAPLTRYLPEFKPRYPEPGAAPVTLRQLAGHSAGVTNFWGRSTSSYTTAQLLDWMRESGLTIQPGFQLKYSNSGIALIGAAMERATGWKYADLMRARIFEPFGLAASGFTTTPPHPDLATSYELKEDRLVPRPHAGGFDAMSPASTLVATIEDVGRFLHAHLAGGPDPQVAEAVLDRLFTPNFPSDGDRGIGLGWFCSWRDGLPYWSHLGAWNNFFSRIVIRPDVGIGLALSTNGTCNPDALIPPLLKVLAASADPRRLDSFTGKYANASGKIFAVQRPADPELTLEIQGVGRLLPMTRHTFRIRNPEGRLGLQWVRFIEEDGRQVMLWETDRLVRRN